MARLEFGLNIDVLLGLYIKLRFFMDTYRELADRASKQEKITIGDYTIEVHPGGRYWVRNKEGEGSEVDQKFVEKVFEWLFKENF